MMCLIATGRKLAAKINFPKAAWEEVKEGLERIYHDKKNGLGEDLSNFCLKVPTGGGKTLIVTKQDRFTPQDITENLVILLLMLPSASRQNKERQLRLVAAMPQSKLRAKS